MKPETYGSLLKQRGFASFLGTQFLGALNDNLLKYVTIFLAGAGMLRGSSGDAGLDISAISLFAVLPALLFTGMAGWLADNFEKRRVLIATKAFEILVMLLAWLALRSGSFRAQLAVLFLLATQFTFFGPSKYGVVPELVEDAALSKANGLLEMSTFLAILLGSVLAGPLFTRFKGRLDLIAGALMGVAVLGSALSLDIPRTRRPASRTPFRLGLCWSEIVEGTRVLRAERRLWFANLGAAYFWFQGALFQMAVVLLGERTLHLDENGVTRLFMALALGIGGGSLLAGRWSGQKVELGLVPLGSLGMGLCSVGLSLAAAGHPGLVPWALAGVGVSAGLFVVPLNALLQQKAEAGAKGRVQAAANFFATLAMVLAAVAYGVLSKNFGMPAETIILLAGIGCFAVCAGMILLLPELLVRCCLWLAVHSLYKMHCQGQAKVPQSGPALLVCDRKASGQGLLIQACVQRFIRFMAPRAVCEGGPARWLFEAGHAISVPEGPRGADASLERARAELKAGHVVCVFIEEPVTRAGLPRKFTPDLDKITRGIAAPILPVRLDAPEGPLFGFHWGSSILNRPERPPHPVTVSFGEAPPAGAKTRTRIQKSRSRAA